MGTPNGSVTVKNIGLVSSSLSMNVKCQNSEGACSLSGGFSAGHLLRAASYNTSATSTDGTNYSIPFTADYDHDPIHCTADGGIISIVISAKLQPGATEFSEVKIVRASATNVPYDFVEKEGQASKPTCRYYNCSLSNPLLICTVSGIFNLQGRNVTLDTSYLTFTDVKFV